MQMARWLTDFVQNIQLAKQLKLIWLRINEQNSILEDATQML